MGSQQLLFVVLSIVLVGIALAIAISLFKANTVEASRNALIHDLLGLAGIARQHYYRPEKLGGCGRDFTKIKSIEMLTSRPANENARYFIISATKDQLILGAKGRIVIEGDTIEVHLRMNETTDQIEIIH